MPARTGRSIALDELLLILQEGLEALGETRLIQDGERVRPHVPLFQAADHDGPRRQVDHCAGTEGGDELAEALRILGHQRSSAFAMGWPRGSRILRATLGSTSRILRRRARRAGRSQVAPTIHRPTTFFPARGPVVPRTIAGSAARGLSTRWPVRGDRATVSYRR